MNVMNLAESCFAMLTETWLSAGFGWVCLAMLICASNTGWVCCAFLLVK